MFGTVPPIPPPFGTTSCNTGSPNPNRVGTMPTNETINTMTTPNVAQNTVDENLPNFLILEEGFMSQMFPPLTKSILQVGKLDKRLKSIIISFLPNDVMKSVIKCKTAKEMWNDLIPFDTRDTKIAALRLKFNSFKSLEVNATFVNSLPRKWLSMNQTQRENNSIKNDCLATLYGKYNYEEGLIDKDSDSDVEEDQRTNNEFMADLNAEFYERALLANQKRLYKRSGRNTGNHQKDYKGKYKGLKIEMAVLTKRIDDLTKGKSEKGKNEKGMSEKGLIAESFNWDDESVSLEDERTTKIRVFMTIAEDEPSVGKADARSGQWVDITMKKVHKLLSMTDGDERKHVLDYTHVDLHYVEGHRKNLLNKFNLLKQELSLHKSELCNLKTTVSINCSLQYEVI
ncbi:hypothetical protein Tco_0343474 [Tanacetum coccineum]